MSKKDHNSASQIGLQDSSTLVLILLSTLADHEEFESYFRPELIKLYKFLSKDERYSEYLKSQKETQNVE